MAIRRKQQAYVALLGTVLCVSSLLASGQEPASAGNANPVPTSKTTDLDEAKNQSSRSPRSDDSIAKVESTATIDRTDSDVGTTLADPAKYKWKVGVKIVTGRNACRNLLVTIPVPTPWPEQTVSIVEENIPSSVHDVTYRELNSGVKQLVIKIRTVPPKTIIELDLTFAVNVNEIVAPQVTGVFSIPEKVDSEIKQYLGVGPGITYRNSKLRKQVKKIVKDQPSAWRQVEAIYDWIRDNIEFREGDPQDCLSAFRAQSGCAEDLVGLFVAMCRAHKVPARMVWVEGHQLAEFYLVDRDNKGHWFPCNVAGLRDFGSNSDPRIILQKGDNIKVPEKEERQKYVAEFVTGSGKSKPAVGFVRELLPN